MEKHVREPGKYFPPMLHILHAVGSRNSALWDSETGRKRSFGPLSCHFDRLGSNGSLWKLL